MAQMFLATAHQDASETHYRKVFEKIFSTRKGAEEALSNVWADLKHIKPIEVEV